MADTARALNRFGLGAALGEALPANSQRWLSDQLARFDPRPAPIAAALPSGKLIEMLRESRAAKQDLKAAAKQSGADSKDMKQQAKQAGMAGPYADLRAAYVDAVGARTAAALTTQTPFAERLVHFWSNHFAVSVDKIDTVGLAGAFEFEAIRPHIMGTFGELLGAAERHPAMLLYLDQAQSVGPGSSLGARGAARQQARAQ